MIGFRGDLIRPPPRFPWRPRCLGADFLQDRVGQVLTDRRHGDSAARRLTGLSGGVLGAPTVRFRLYRFSSAALFGVALLSCTSQQRAGWTLGWKLEEYSGQVLRVRENGPGSARLEVEREYDPTLRHFLETSGYPDYIYVIDRYTLQIVYIDDDRVVLFQRPTLNPKSQATVTDGIPDGLSGLFARSDQERLKAARVQRRQALPAPQPSP